MRLWLTVALAGLAVICSVAAARAADVVAAHDAYITGSQEEALGNLVEASHWYSLAARDDPENVIYTLCLASCETKTGHFAESAALLRSAIRRDQSLMDRGQLLLSLAEDSRKWAQNLMRLQQPGDAAKRIDDAIAADHANASPDEATDLSMLASLYEGAGFRTAQIDALLKALAITRQYSQPAAEERVLIDLGLARWRAGDYNNGLAALGQARDLDTVAALGLGDEIETDIGAIDRSAGRYGEALGELQKAYASAKARGDNGAAAAAAADLGAVEHSVGAYEAAARTDRDALQLCRSANDKASAATIEGNLAYAEFFEKQYAAARRDMLQSLADDRSLADRPAEQAALSDLGRMDMERGRMRDAAAEIASASQIAASAGDTAGAAICAIDSATLALKEGRWASARDGGYRALIALREADDPALIARAESLLMAALNAGRLNNESIFWGKQAVNRFQDLRGRLTGFSREDKARYLDEHSDAYRQLADILIASGRLTEAVQVLKLLKSEELDEFDRGGEVLVRGGRPPVRGGEVLIRGSRPPIRGGEVLLRGQRPPVRAGVAPPREPGGSDDDQIGLTSQENLMANRLETARSPEMFERYAAGFATAPAISIAQQPAPAATPPSGCAYIATLVSPQAVRIVAVTPHGIHSASMIIPKDRLRALTIAYRVDLEQGRPAARIESQRLCRIVLPPQIETALLAAGVTRLYWSLDDALRYVPIGALDDGRGYLIRRWSSSVVAPVTAPSAAGGRLGVLAMGVSAAHVVVDPATGDTVSFPALPSALAEVKDAVASSSLPGTALLDADFTFSGMRRQLHRRYSAVHIASHFRLVPGDATCSSLLLGDGGLLSVARLGQMRGALAGVSLVSLSGCSTADLPSEASGREVDGLAGVLVRDGAECLVASLWNVEDPSAAEFMRRFHQDRRDHPDRSAADSVAAVQRQLIGDRSSASGSPDPSIWAPYVVYVPMPAWVRPAVNAPL